MPKLSLAKLERHLYSAADRLRQEGLDAATYKDYIFGLLFLKRCSDVFDAERERIVGRKLEQGLAKEEAERQYGENPDFYDTFFVPERARWAYLLSKLSDANDPYGNVLDKALAALSEHNETLEHVLDHISFMRVQNNKRIVSDDACKDLVRHFSRYRLRNEDFQFSDLLGAAYEFLINMFAESAGKKGGDFYTPRDVIRLMVRILKPAPGMSIFDPTCGSGGMLIISREFIEQSGGNPANLRLCGQVNDASAWSICKLNMLLHGLPGAEIQLEDTLLHPMHRDGGELERFDRVIANPPFSQNYTRSNMEFPERFRWGWAPTTGKKGDLMFAQHMVAVCKTGGMVATVMPHGVLFRGGAEKEIRRKFLEQDLIEAVIGLPPNLFYGAGIPACILVMRPNLTGQSLNPNKPANRRGQALFINADAEFYAGRAQNYLRPEHVEKIASTFERYEDVPGYARRVSLEEIADPANDWNLNIRRYVDNSPPPEPHDVRAHLQGGVPVAEVEAKQSLFDALGFDPAHAFAKRPNDAAYFDFALALTDRAAIRQLAENDEGVQARVRVLREALAAWWSQHSARLADLPERRNLNAVRAEFLDSFVAALEPLAALDRFKLAGVIASWWNETLPDFKTLVENGFPGVIDGWVDAIADAVEDDDNAGPAFDPFGHKLVRRTMTDYLERIAQAKADIARLRGEKEAFEQSNPPDDADEEELANWNYAKDLERQARELKTENRDAIKELAKLERDAAKPRATDEGKKAATAARAALQPIFDQLAAIDDALAPYEQIKSELAASRACYSELTDAFVDELKNRCAAMDNEEKRELVLELFEQDVGAGFDAAVAEKRQAVVWFIEGLWDKYRVMLTALRSERLEIETRLGEFLRRLSYA
ncbi:MAG: type I restriction-modification system subunit M [Acidobacteria bacterium]|nr:type I restriction-modification system subunit M [Acidobacteriota bacterium]